MYKDSKRTCIAIVLLIKLFVWWHSRRRRRRGLLKLPNKRRPKYVYVGWNYLASHYYLSAIGTYFVSEGVNFIHLSFT